MVTSPNPTFQTLPSELLGEITKHLNPRGLNQFFLDYKQGRAEILRRLFKRFDDESMKMQEKILSRATFNPDIPFSIAPNIKNYLDNPKIKRQARIDGWTWLAIVYGQNERTKPQYEDALKRLALLTVGISELWYGKLGQIANWTDNDELFRKCEKELFPDKNVDSFMQLLVGSMESHNRPMTTASILASFIEDNENGPAYIDSFVNSYHQGQLDGATHEVMQNLVILLGEDFAKAVKEDFINIDLRASNLARLATLPFFAEYLEPEELTQCTQPLLNGLKDDESCGNSFYHLSILAKYQALAPEDRAILTQHLIDGLRDKNFRRRRAAFDVLGDLAKNLRLTTEERAQCIQPLIAALQARRELVCVYAFHTLRTFFNFMATEQRAKCIQCLIAALGHRNFSIEDAAFSALRIIAKDLKPEERMLILKPVRDKSKDSRYTLTEWEENIRPAACKALSILAEHLKPEERSQYIQPLINHLNDRHAWLNALRALPCFAKVLKGEESMQCIQPVINMLEATQWERRVYAFNVLPTYAHLLKGEERARCIQLLINGHRHENVLTREAAYIAFPIFAKFMDREERAQCIQVLIDRFGDEFGSDRDEAFEALLKFANRLTPDESRQIRPLLINGLWNVNSDVRLKSINALAAIVNIMPSEERVQFVQPLTDRLRDDHRDVKAAATETLYALTRVLSPEEREQCIQRLLNSLRSTREDTPKIVALPILFDLATTQQRLTLVDTIKQLRKWSFEMTDLEAITRLSLDEAALDDCLKTFGLDKRLPEIFPQEGTLSIIANNIRGAFGSGCKIL